jgi:drug/metabolite transporter (DMT)-like permease
VKTVGILAGLAAASIWGGMYVVSKVVLDVVPPFSLLTLRLVIGAAALGAVVLVRGWPGLEWRLGCRVLGVGLLGYGISLGFQFVGTKLSTAANAALVTSASPAFMYLFGVWILQERLTVPGILGLALASGGVVAVVDPAAARLQTDLLWGNLSLIAAALTWGLYSVLVRWVSRDLGTLQVSLLAFIGGLAVTIPAAMVELRFVRIGEITPGVIWGILYLGLVSTALAMYLWNKSLALLEAGMVAVLFFAQPLVGAGLGVLLLGEELHIGFWIGAALIAAGLLLAARSAPRERPIPVPGDRDWGDRA